MKRMSPELFRPAPKTSVALEEPRTIPTPTPESNVSDEEKLELKYERYASSGGTANKKEYEHVMNRKLSENITWPLHAKFMATLAEIAPLSDDILERYGVLCDERADPAIEHYSHLSDQKLLAEALLMSGDMKSFFAFIGKYPHIFPKEN
jgi:hypothetical protein